MRIRLVACQSAFEFVGQHMTLLGMTFVYNRDMENPEAWKTRVGVCIHWLPVRHTSSCKLRHRTSDMSLRKTAKKLPFFV